MTDSATDTADGSSWIRFANRAANYVVDLAALGTLAYLATHADPGVATELGSMAVAIAGAKRYLERKYAGAS